jgi:hypothetical protein
MWCCRGVLGAPTKSDRRQPSVFVLSLNHARMWPRVCESGTTEDTPHVDDQVGAVPGSRARPGAPARGDDLHGHHITPVRTTHLRPWKGLTGAGRLDLRR